MSPRTTWRAKPCGWRDRERVVALGEEFGPAGPLILDVLEELTKEQRDDGEVRTGLRSLARAAFLPRGSEGIALARNILTFAAKVGALDNLAIAGDADMTVTCRVSGFSADQGKGYESVRKGWQRSGHGPEDRDNEIPCPDERDSVPVCPPTEQDRTEENKGTTSSELAKASPDAIRLSHLLADLILERDAKAKVTPESDRWLAAMRLLLADRDGDVGEVERVLRWSQADSFWQANILSPGKLRDKFTQLTAKMQATPLRAVAGSGVTRPGWPDDHQVAALVRDLFPPDADADRARHVVLAAWGMGHREAPAILEWASKTDPELLEPAA